MYEVLGIEAARKCLFNEILEVMNFDGTYLNHHHIHLLCDRMTCNKKLVSIFRHGINKDDIGPIAKASFEETSEMFLQAARHGELDNMKGVSANIMCGQEGYYGTSCFQLYADNDLLFKYHKEMNLDDDEVIDEDDLQEGHVEDIIKNIENKQKENYGSCSIDNIKITDTLVENTTSSNKILNNDYDLNI